MACSPCSGCANHECSVCATRLHLQDTACTVHVHLEAAGRAFSTKHTHRACTSEIKMIFHECSGCAVPVQGVCGEHAPSVQHTFREGTLHVLCVYSVCRECAHVHSVQCVGNERASGMQPLPTCADIRQDTCTALTDTKVCICVSLSLVNRSLQEIHPPFRVKSCIQRLHACLHFMGCK